MASVKKYIVGDAGAGGRLRVKIADFTTIPKMLPSNVVIECSECTDFQDLKSLTAHAVQITNRHFVELFLCKTCGEKSLVR
jgi:hypothetical protein